MYLGSGDGALQTGRPVDAGDPVSLAVADVNGDRTLDLIVGYLDGPTALYLNDDGEANFAAEPQRFGPSNAWALL